MRAGRRPGTAALICLLLVALAGGCASLGFERPDSLMEEGRQLYLEKKYDEAIAKFERVPLQSGDWTQALFHLGRALQLNPSTPEASDLLRGLR